MKTRFKLGTVILSVLACCALLLAQFPAALPTSAVVAGTDPLIDPTVNTDKTLPEGYDQGLKDGLPYGYFVVDDSATYSFGTAMDSKGNLYTSSYSKGTISVRYKDAFGYISLLSEERTIKMDTGAIFGLAINSDDDIVYCVCYDQDGYVAIYDQETETSTAIIPGLVRPNDCFVDGQDNVYVACENGVIKKWEKATGEVTVVASGLGGLQSVAVDKTGVVYALTYSIASDVPLIGVAIRGGTLYQINTDGSVERVAGNNNQYVWRSRGLAIDEYGYVLLTGEGNAWDNGNSSLVARYDPLTRSIEPVSTGMDYLTFITYGEDGRIYGSLARDDKSIAYSEAAEDDFVLQSGWDSVGDSRIITYGGSYAKGGTDLTLQVGSLTFSGTATLADGSHKLSGWISIPVDSLPEVSKEEKDGGLRGRYPVPEVTVASAQGTGKATAMVLREHVRSRWPMIDLYTNAADFSEAPEAYLVYFEWTPEDLNTYVDKAETHDIYRTTGVLPAAPGYNGATIDTLDFSGSAAATVLDEETGITAIALSESGNTAYTRYMGNDLEIAFRIDESVGDWLGISVDNRAASTLGEGVGLRTLLWTGGNVTARMVNTYAGLGWDAAAATQTLHDGPAAAALNSGWHTLRITNNFGEWDVYVDGVCITKNAYAGFDADMAELVGGAATFITFYSATGKGQFSVRVATEDDTAAKSKLTFGSRGEAWAHDLETNIYSTVGITNSHYITGNLEEGVEFEYKASGIQDWFFMNIGNADAVFPTGDDFFYDFCHGTGLKVMAKTDGSAEARLITKTESAGWEGAPWKNTTGGISSALVNDDTWHKVSISKASGTWSVKIDGRELLDGIDGANLETLNSKLDGDTGYVVIGANAYVGTLQVREVYETDDQPDTPADPQGKLTFASRGQAWAYDIETNVYSTVGITNTHYMTGDLEEGVEFEFLSSGISDWFFMNIGNASAVFPEGDDFFYDFCHGTGVKLLIKTGGDAEARLITQTESVGWNNAPWKNNVSGVASTFNDGTTWHKVSISKAGGQWSIKVNGVEMLDGVDAANLETLNSKLDGEIGYIVIGANGHTGNVSVRENAAGGDSGAAASGELTFASRGEAWAYDIETNVYSTVGITNTHYMTGDLEAGVEFEFLSSGISDWFFMNIGNASAVFPEGDDFFYDFCHGTGVKLLIKTGGGVEARLITQTEAAGWDSAPWKNKVSGVASTFNDGITWHKVSISKASGQWSIKVNGVEMLDGVDAANLETLNSKLDGDTGYIVLGANGHTGNVSVRENAAGGDSGAAASGELTFASQGEAWAYDLETKVYSTVGITNTHYMTGDLEAGVEFEYKASGISDWFFFNIGNAAAVFPEGDAFFYDFCHGTGLKVLCKTDGSAEARLITQTEGAGWDGAPWKNSVGGIATALVNDDAWHKVSISKAGGQWSVKVDGVEMLDGIDADNLETLNSKLDGDTGYIVIGANGHTGSLQVRDLYTSNEDGDASDGDLAKLGLKIQVAKNLFNTTKVGVNYGQVSQEAKDALAVAGKAAVAVAENTKASATDVAAAIDDLQAAIDAFKVAVVESCNFGDLATMLQSAQNMFNKSSVGTEAGQVPQENYDEMEAAIASAVQVYRTQGVTQAMLDAELAALTEVVTRFASAVVVDTTPIAFDWLAQNSASFENLDAETIHAVLPIAGSQVNTTVNPVNLTFKVRIDPSQNFEWFSLVFSNSGANRLAGDGVCAVFWLNYTADIRVVESVSGKGWDGEGKNRQLFAGTLAGDSFADAFKDFNDGEWAEFKLGRNADGTWYFTLDGKDLILNEYEGIWSDFDRLLGGGNTVTMNLYTNGTYGEVDVYQDTTGAKVSFGALNTLIEQAETLLAETESNRAPASAFEALRKAIADAEAVKADPDVTFDQASAAKDAMQAAINEFLAMVELTYDAIEFEKDIAAFGTEVNEDNLYDALIVVDTWEALTAEQQAMVSDKAVEDLETLRKGVYALLRSENGVTIGGENLPYFVHILLDNYQAESSVSFNLDAEDWLTLGAYTLGEDGEFTVTVELPEGVKDGAHYKVTMTYADGTAGTAVVAVKDGKASFKATAAGNFSLAETDEDVTENTPPADNDSSSPDTGSASVLPAVLLLLVALSVVLATRRTAKTN